MKAQQDMGETMGELGLAFIKLTKFENEEAVFNTQRTRANDMKNLATAAVKASRFYRELNSQTVKHLVKIYLYCRNIELPPYCDSNELLFAFTHLKMTF